MAEPLLDRRAVPRLAAIAGLGVPAASALLQACGGSEHQASEPQLASPSNPVRWQVRDDNPPIEDGLSPEAGP